MCCDGFWQKEAAPITNAVESVATGIGNTIENVAKNSLPVIETVALTAVGVPPAVSSALVSTLNGGSLEDAIKAGAGAYIGGQVSDATYGSVAGLDAGPPTATDATLGKVAGSAAAGGTTAAVTGKDIGKGIVSGATSGVGDIASQYASGATKDALSDYSQPVQNIAAGTVGGAAKGATTAGLTGQDILKGAEKGATAGLVRSGTQEAVSGLDSYFTDGKPNASFDSAISNLISQGILTDMTSKSGNVGDSTVIGGVQGTVGSPAAFGATDVAQVTPSEMGSKVSKKGGKYPWGTPEGTSALKEGLGI